MDRKRISRNLGKDTVVTNGQPKTRKGLSFAAKAKRNIAMCVYGLMLLYYVVSDAATSFMDKLKIYAAIGYILTPLDLIPNSIHLAGFTDDLAAIGIAYTTVRQNLTIGILRKAANRIWRWFKVRLRTKLTIGKTENDS